MSKCLCSETCSCHRPRKIMVVAAATTSRWNSTQPGRAANRYLRTRQRYVDPALLLISNARLGMLERVTAFQASLLDCAESVQVGPLGSSVRRRELSDGAWIDLRPRWISGADPLFERLQADVPWHAERRPM